MNQQNTEKTEDTKKTAEQKTSEQKTAEQSQDSYKAGIRQDLKILFSGAAVVLACVVVALFLRRGRLTVYFKADVTLNEDDVSIEVEDPSSVVVTGIAMQGRMLKLTFLSNEGEGSEVTVSTPGRSYLFMLSRNRLGMLVSTMNRNFSGWAAIVFGGTAFAIFASAVLLKGWLGARNKALLSYLSAARLGFFIFLAIFAVLGLILSVIYLVDPAAYTFDKVIDAVSYTTLYTALASAPFAALFSVLLCVSNISLIRHEGFKPVNVLGIVLSFAIAFFFALGIFLFLFIVPESRSSFSVVLIDIYYGFYMVFECLLFAILIIFFRINRHVPSFDQDCVVILGCRIRSDGTLFPLIRGRVDKAVEFARLQEEKTGKAPVFIPSGGQGKDEVMAEAEAMKNYLLSIGIPGDRILPETESLTTEQNMRFSRKIAEEYKPGAKAIFATTNYHVFRSGIIAARTGWPIDGIGSRTKWYFWPNALIREFIGIILQSLGIHRS